MKPRHKIFLTSLALLFVVINAHCQTKVTEGKIVYNIVYPDSTGKQKVDSLNIYEEEYWFKNNNQRNEIFSNSPFKFSCIYIQKTNRLTYITDNSGVKIATIINYDFLNMKRIKQINRNYKYSNESKIINGYTCFKVEYTFGHAPNKYYAYFTKDIIIPMPFILIELLSGLNGFPMEYNDYRFGYEQVHIIKNISAEKVDDSLFVIPKEYKIEYSPESIK